MNLKLLFNLKINENLQENWLKFKNELTLLYMYYFEMNRDECIGMFKLVQKTLSSERAANQHSEENLNQIKYVLKDIKEHLEYLRTYKEIK